MSESASAQDLLEKKISIRVNNLQIDETLRKLGELGGFSFSYSPDVIDVKRKITLQVTNRSVREILNEIFRGKVGYKERRKYIILQNLPETKESETPANFNLNGYILDNATGEKLANASIYESVTLASTISNQYGYYKIRLPAAAASLRLEIRKEDYTGRSISIPGRKDRYLPIALNPDTLRPLSTISPRILPRTDSLYQRIEIPDYNYTVFDSTISTNSSEALARQQYQKLKKTYQTVQTELGKAFASAKQAVNIRNITDTLYRPFQASILPFLGTNHNLSGNIVNKVSLNLFAGYSLGVNGLELGAILNVVRGNVSGFQLAGIGNLVGNDVTGFQYANFLNLTLGNFKGFQGSPLINYTRKNFQGFQFAGAGNVLAGTLNGYQFSPTFNYAKNVQTGHQIGLANYADYSETTPFGLFSYVQRNGYRRYEFAASEFNYFNFSFKTGMKRFYNIFSIGFNGTLDNKPLGTLGYGFGTAQNLGKGWMLNQDITANAVFIKKLDEDEIPAGHFRFSLGVEKKLGQRFALFLGPSVNWLTGDEEDLINPANLGIVKPLWIGKNPDSKSKSYGWIGFQVGIRFCNPI
ncbi:hypothetical protein E0F88_10270 [Dyadobacter psychrotolerans]|uniref:Secretin/TonB short N-terminal domain-containing protein n=1 Tax=Dyadobacter psychrotolerans TaxID=2541721 RepID=A0A4R5DRF4_9BACT|nr:hypothetical protein E0F88_10270 [Dyadobacter psychrotolerans]